MTEYMDIREQVEEQRYSILYLEMPTIPKTYVSIEPETAVNWINDCETRNIPIQSYKAGSLWGFQGTLTLSLQ